MAYELTWAFDTNRVVGDISSVKNQTAWQLWYIKAFLLGQVGGMTSGLWTTYYSCDGTTAGAANDGVDRWGNAFDSTKIVRANGAVAHSWYVLKSPSISAPSGASSYYLILDYNAANDYQAQILFAKSAPTGGSTTARPTSVDQWQPNGGAVNLNNNSAAARKMHGGLTSRGDFYVLGSRDTSGVCDFAVVFQVLANTKAGDPYPGWSYVYGTGGSTTALAANGNASGSLTQLATNSCAASRYYDNSVQASTPIFEYVTAAASVTLVTHFSAADAVDSTWPDMPLWVLVTQGTGVIKSIKGRLADFALCPSSVGSGQVDGVSPTKGSVGNLWVPLATAMSL